MNTGIVSARYAKALLLYTEERGSTERVCAQARELLASANANPVLEPELQEFCSMVISKGRRSLLKEIMQSYISQCFKLKGIKLVKLTSASEASELTQKIRSYLEQQFGTQLIFETSVNPQLIGGFVLEIDGQRLDASIKNQIEELRKQFVKNNNRIV